MQVRFLPGPHFTLTLLISGFCFHAILSQYVGKHIFSWIIVNLNSRNMPRIKNLERLINAENLNKAIIEFDNFICGCGLDDLTEPQRHFHFNQELERAINMDGFHLYFWNPAGEFALETITSLKAIGAHHTWPL